jgi:hypothetical protein
MRLGSINVVQKLILVSGLVALCVSSVHAPYSYSGQLTVDSTATNGPLPLVYVGGGTIYAPLWSPPSRELVRSLSMKESSEWVEDAEAGLVTRQLGLTYAAIVAVTIGLIFVVGRSVWISRLITPSWHVATPVRSHRRRRSPSSTRRG